MDIVVISLALIVGVVLGSLGGGGSILLVPLLVYVGGRDPREAIAASLLVVAITSAFASVPHARAGRVAWPTAGVFGAAGMVGAYAGGRLGGLIPATVLLVAFAVMMAVTAVGMLRRRDNVGHQHLLRPSWTRIALDGLGVGLVTGMVGAGGGFLVVPALVLLGGLSMPSAIGTSLIIIAMKSAAGLAGYLATVPIDMRFVLAVAGAATVGALFGARLVERIDADRLRRVFGVFVLLMSSVVLLQELPPGLWTFTFAAIPPVAALLVLSRGRRASASAAPTRSAAMHVVTIETPSLGDRTYLVHDGEVGLVVDPQRDTDRVEAALAVAGIRLVAVFETHVHNDYVSGGLALAGAHGAAYHVAADETVAFDRVPVRDGDEVAVGSLTVRVVHTPGHTPTHLSYVVSSGGADQAVLTGGGLLFGSVGRTDLVGVDRTEELTRAQHRSAHRLAGELGDDVAVLPTHGFGSFCSSGSTSGASASTIGEEREHNGALIVADEDTFVTELLRGLDAWPAYYVHMAPRNLAGANPIDLTPPAVVDALELRRRVHAGEWVVDLRDRRAFAGGHLVGSINVGLDDSFSTYLGWILDWGAPLTLITATADEAAAAQRQLARIGVDELAGTARTDDVAHGHAGRYPVADVAALVAARDTDSSAAGIRVLDTRLTGEWRAGHLPGALHIPLHELLARMDEVPMDVPVWVHCASGYRASIAASLLARAGRDVTLVDGEVADVDAPLLAVGR